MNDLPSLRERLQIVLITFNREQHLRRTLSEILARQCPIHDFDITVIDNNSTDGTRQVVQSFQSEHQNLKYIKNPYNLGIGGNIFKAMECASKEYLWTICDDDKYFWDGWHCVEDAVAAGEKVICAANFNMLPENRHGIAYPLYQMTFLPSLIIARSLYTDTTIRNAFDNAFGLFPHLVPIITHINQGGTVYITKEPIVEAGNLAQDMAYTRGCKLKDLFLRTRTMSFFAGYAGLLANLTDKKLRNECFDVMICGKHVNHIGYGQFLYGLFKHCKGKDFTTQFTDIKMGCHPTLAFMVGCVRALQKTPLHALLCNERSYAAIVKIVNSIRCKFSKQ